VVRHRKLDAPYRLGIWQALSTRSGAGTPAPFFRQDRLSVHPASGVAKRPETGLFFSTARRVLLVRNGQAGGLA